MSLAPRTRRLALAVLAVAAATSALPSWAAAAPYEQINRTSGANGTSPLWGYASRGTAVGDLGRYAGWEDTPSGVATPTTQGYVRDIVLNTTYTYGGGVQRVYGFDRAETRALLLRTRSGKRQVVVVPIAGGAPLIVAEFSDPAQRTPEAALSGDGRKVVVSAEGYGTKVFALTGGTVRLSRVLSATTWIDRFGSRAISDDGGVVLGYDANVGRWWIWGRSGGQRELWGAQGAAVDPIGTTAAWVNQSEHRLIIRNLLTGADRSYPVNPTSEGPSVLWIAPGGTSLVLAQEYYDTSGVGPAGAQRWSPGAGQTSTSTPFGSRFSSVIRGGYDPTLISADGRFLLTGGSGGKPIALMSSSASHIVGANEGFSASAYLLAGSFVETCGVPAKFQVGLVQPQPFVPKPVKAVLTARVDGRVIASGTISKAIAYGQVGYPLPEGEPGWLVEGDYDAATGGDVSLTATVTDGSGRTTTESWVEPDQYCS